MQQGVCIKVGLSTVLKENHTYFLREHGENNYYVSNFDNPKSYFGSFSKKHFRLIAESQRILKRFVAKVSKNYTWYTLGDEYIITEKDHNGYFHVYMKNRPHRGGPIGSYLNNFFEIIEPFNEEKSTATLNISQESALKVGKVVSKTVSDVPKKAEECGQLSLFDL